MDSHLRLKHNYLSSNKIGLSKKFDKILNKIVNKYLLLKIISLGLYHKGIIYYLIKYLNKTDDDIKNELLIIILSKITKYKDKDLNRIQSFNNIGISSTDLIFLVFYDSIKDNIKIKEDILRFTLPIIEDYSFKTDTTLHGLLLHPIIIQKKTEKIEENNFVFRKNYDIINDNVRNQILNNLYKTEKKGREMMSKKNILEKPTLLSQPENKISISLSNNIVIYKKNISNNNKIIYIILFISAIISLILFIILKMYFL